MKESNLPYYDLPALPKRVEATNAIARMVDALAFRYRWATEGLREQDVDFRPIESSMSVRELLIHIYKMACGTAVVFGINMKPKEGELDFEALRKETLLVYQKISEQLYNTSDQELDLMENANGKYPFWYWINGPIADALTHVGQIVSWRRINGNPQPSGLNMFVGRGKQ